MLRHAEEMIQKRFSRKFQVVLVFEGACVGLLAGMVVTLYRLALAHAEDILLAIRSFLLHNLIFIPIWALCLLILMIIVSRLMLWEPYTQGSGIPQIDAEVAGKVNMPYLRVLFAKFVEGTLCTLAGLSLGREGPSVQLGGMSGKAISKLFKKEHGEERILVTCGAGAGMAAAFHAPLTGVMFTLEEIHKVFTAPLIISVMVSCVVSDFFVAQILGIQPVLSMHFAIDIPHTSYPLIILMGIVVGVLGAVHNKGMFYAQHLYTKLTKFIPYSRLIIPFSLSLVVLFIFPDILCGGDSIIHYLNGLTPQPLNMLVLLLVGKYIFTAICFGSGAPGGTLFPLVVMGALAGAIFGDLAVLSTGLHDAYITNFMVLGIAALFSAVVRAPVTGIMLAFELTGTLDSMLSAAIVAIVAYVTANITKIEPFYEKLLHDFLGRSHNDEDDENGEKILHEHIVETGSLVEDKMIQDIVWPESALIVTIKRAGQDIIPHGNIRLQAMDNLLVIMDVKTEFECEQEIKRLCSGILGLK